MRYRMILVALLAGSAFSPAMAQAVEATISAAAETQTAVRPVAMAQGQEQRRGRGEGGGGWRGRGADGTGDAPPQQVERAPRQDWQQRQQAAPQAQSQTQPQPRREWDRERAARLDGNVGDNASRGWQRREMPVISTPAVPVAQAVPAQVNRNWRGNNANGSTWNRGEARQAPVPGTNPNWQRGRDRDGDGIRNARDRDRDNDGIRNNRDWDRNNDGRVDRRWDGNNNGVVDRRYDRNSDGVRNNGGSWNRNGQNWDQRNGNDRNWNREWRNDNRYDWQRYRSSNRNLFRAPRYYSPYGYNYSYQRFGIGIYLDQVFFGSRYRIDNPGQYRLPYAEWPYEWVRYYDDVLLVDTRNGYIVDVIHDFFW
jgi:Nickel/cobalt transporter regulator